MHCAGPGLGPKLGAGGTARRPWGRSPPRAGPRSRWVPPDMPDPASALLVPVLRPRVNVASPERPAGSGSGAPLGGSRGRRERTRRRLGWGPAHLRPGEPRQAAVTCGDPGRAGGGVTTVGGGRLCRPAPAFQGPPPPAPEKAPLFPGKVTRLAGSPGPEDNGRRYPVSSGHLCRRRPAPRSPARGSPALAGFRLLS